MELLRSQMSALEFPGLICPLVCVSSRWPGLNHPSHRGGSRLLSLSLLRVSGLPKPLPTLEPEKLLTVAPSSPAPASPLAGAHSLYAVRLVPVFGREAVGQAAPLCLVPRSPLQDTGRGDFTQGRDTHRQ